MRFSPGADAQSLSVSPRRPEVGDAVRIRFREAGAEVSLAWAGGGRRVLGRTGAGGELVWRPQRAGRAELRCEPGDVGYVLVVDVLEPHGFMTFTLPCLLAVIVLYGAWHMRAVKTARSRRGSR